MTLLAVVVAGALGAASRFVLDHALTLRASGLLPRGTLLVNAAGSALAGALAGLAARHGLDDTVRVVAGAGFLAAFTTFSTFAVETVRLAEQHAGRTAALNAAAHLVLSTAAAGLMYAVLTAT